MKYFVLAGMTAACALFVSVATVGEGRALAADEAQQASSTNLFKNNKIAYVLTDRRWSVYQTPDSKTECPDGFNDGPREQFKALFPIDKGQKWTVMETQLKREGQQWFPKTSEDPFTFKESKSKISIGLNLDGKVDANDFDSPEGEKGIDNQLYRAIGCIANYRGPEGTIYHFENEYMRRYNNNRMIFEITDVESLENDADVKVTTYRGLDPLLTDATGGAFIPGGTQRADMRWGKMYIQHFKGKIVDGVLTTEPADLLIPWGITFATNGYHNMRGAVLKVKLTPETANGVLAGYTDVESFNHHLNTSWSTHHQSYGQLSAPSLYRAMNRLADGYPDPKTGANTAISSSITVKFTQVFVEHPDQKISQAPGNQNAE